MTAEQLNEQYQTRASAEREGGATVEINWRFEYVDFAIEENGLNLTRESYLLAIAQGW